MRLAIQLVSRYVGASSLWLPLTVVVTACMPHREFCEERDAPDNTCFASYFIENAADCLAVPGCAQGEICVAANCDTSTVRNAYDAGTRLYCSQGDQIACAKLSKSDCAVDTKCVWAVGCGGTPKVDCASFKELTACMNSRVCIWQIES